MEYVLSIPLVLGKDNIGWIICLYMKFLVDKPFNLSEKLLLFLSLEDKSGGEGGILCVSWGISPIRQATIAA